MISAGNLNNEIILKRKSAVPDAMGGEIITWTAVATVAAKAEPVLGRPRGEPAVLLVEQSTLVMRFTIYYREDVDGSFRAEWRGRDYELIAPPLDIGADKKWLELTCVNAQT